MEDNNVYYKKGKKYIPFGLYRSGHDYIPDGIWYVRHYDYSTGITNVDKYIAGLCKVGEVPSRLDIPKLCSIQDYCEYIIDSKEWKELMDKGYSWNTLVHKVVALILEKNKEFINKK